MKHSLMIRLLCVMLCAALFLCGAALAEQTDTAPESGELRVYLKSLGEVYALNIELNGSYSLNADEDFRFDENASLRVTAVGSEVWLAVGGINMNMGEGLTLTRHKADGDNGLFIEGSPRGKLYCGSLRLTAEKGLLKPVLLIDIEEYLLGVVPYEMSDSFPLEALKAQAVAARTYALQRRAARTDQDYDVVDTTADQVFMGYDPAFTNAVQAVSETKGLCGTYNGNYATCYYTASNGGQTAMAHDILGVTSDDGYLAIADDPYDVENPSSKVTALSLRADAYNLPELLVKEMKASAAEHLAAMNMSEEAEDIFIDEIVSVVPHTPLAGEPNRMYQTLTVAFRISACPMVPVYSQPTNIDDIHALFGRNTYEPVLLGEETGEPVLLEDLFSCEISVYEGIKNLPGMRISSIDCEITTVTEQQGAECKEFLVELRRYGHGVGMSQRGAQWMAGEYAKTCAEILTFYYPGLTFEEKAFEEKTLPALDVLPEGVSMGSTGTKKPQAELPPLKDGEKYAAVTLSTAWSTLNMRAAPSTDATILTILSHGWRVIVMDEADGWAHVKTADAEGYVSSQYLVME